MALVKLTMSGSPEAPPEPLTALYYEFKDLEPTILGHVHWT